MNKNRSCLPKNKNSKCCNKLKAVLTGYVDIFLTLIFLLSGRTSIVFLGKVDAYTTAENNEITGALARNLTYTNL